ncbi:MAG: undecaprenyldiphospho-muramoylpentapeptide beta-N-acetylglucosaminyltransferase [Candidatus Marinimicrobia bacterium]|nr:undecaprenyldiphospho-muramoylpentapeptide beta-N-acetylglucosaminyltransferase [Candidatus Neomarinimicrobiota bacterium]
MPDQDDKEIRIVIAGGGTGGHLFPALGIARALRAESANVRITFIGSRFGLEARILPDAGEEVHLLTIRGLQRGFSLRSIGRNLMLPWRFIRAYLASAAILRRVDPHVVVGTGGYAAALPLAAAQRRNIPTLLQEQNSYPGLTTRRLAPRASHVCLNDEAAAPYLGTDRWSVTGNPVALPVVNVDPAQARKTLGMSATGRVIFILGGSQGSRPLNDHFLSHWQTYTESMGVHLLWQTGASQYDQVAGATGESGKVTAIPFIDDMAAAYAAADLVICRAGAMTLSELTLQGKPSILVPLPSAAADHQTHNAKGLAGKGAAVALPQSDLPSGALEKIVTGLLADPEALSAMGAAARRAAQPQAGAAVATEILKLAQA